MKDNSDKFDMSDYPHEQSHQLSFLFNKMNMEVRKKFKAKTTKKSHITDITFLKTKIYAYKTYESGDMWAKGIPKTFVKRHQQYDKYVNTINTAPTTLVHGVKLESNKHIVYSSRFAKKGLSQYDDKRYSYKNDCLAHGHYKIKDIVKCKDNNFNSNKCNGQCIRRCPNICDSMITNTWKILVKL